MKTNTTFNSKLAAAMVAALASIAPITEAQKAPHYGMSSVVIASHYQTWQNVSNAFFNDGEYASVKLSSGNVSDTMEISNFNFKLPADAIIEGVTVTIKKGAIGQGITDNMVKLICNGSVCGANYATADEWLADPKVVTYGGNNDTWGLNMTASEINSYSFGVALCVSSTMFSLDSVTANVDYINVSVKYRKPENIELTDFTAYFDEKQVALDWTMASETGCVGFTIERSKDGVTPEIIGTVDGNLNADDAINYSFTDDNPLSGVSYYRIEERRADGSVKDFNWVAVSSEEKSTGMLIYPNPAVNEVTVKFPSLGQSAMLMIIDAVGKVVVNETVPSFANEDNTTYIQDISYLPHGNYIVLVNNGSTNFTDKLVK